ncbi:hypothetical protein PU02_0691 [Bartonella ancashensis]|uniref:Uncharacterized protein n=1 Tax=Bartonella ancashensis TaxID=1318743 RepID=A0A0M3T2X6_9HYPH|nr:hypothetical protein PU02_0691 [Bartonella ancashensis]
MQSILDGTTPVISSMNKELEEYHAHLRNMQKHLRLVKDGY